MEHFIKNIEIANFKSIRQATVKDCRRVNVFVGPPNVGKSNILEALSLFSVIKDVNTVKLKDLVRVTEDPTIFFNGNIDEALTITIDDEFRLEGRYQTGDFVLSAVNLFRFEPMEEFDEDSIEPPLQYRTLSFRKYEYLETIKLNLPSFKEHVFPYPKKYEFRKHTEVNPTDYSVLSYPFGENLFSIIQTNPEIRKQLAALLADYDYELLFDSSYRKFSIFKRTNDGIFSVDYSLIADTLQRLFFYKTAILSNKDQILLLEEPESHMYPPYISKMTGDIIYDENNNQFFIATHSPYVLNDLIEDVEKEDLSIYIVGYDPKVGETLIHRMNEEEVHEAYQMGYQFFINIENFLPKTQHEQI